MKCLLQTLCVQSLLGLAFVNAPVAALLLGIGIEISTLVEPQRRARQFTPLKMHGLGEIGFHS